MNELVKALDTIGEKQWFTEQMGMTRCKSVILVVNVLTGILCGLSPAESSPGTKDKALISSVALGSL